VGPPDSALVVGPGIGQVWGEQVAQQMALALNGQRLYGAFHSTVLRACDGVARALSHLLEEEPEFRISLSGGGVSVNGRAISSAKRHLANLVRACACHGVAHIVFRRGATAADVTELVYLLGKVPEELSGQGGLSWALAKQGVECVVCEASRSARKAGEEQSAATADALLMHTCTTALEIIQESAQQARLGRMLNASAARALAAQLTDNVIEDQGRLLGLLSVRRHDQYTFQHSLNVSVLVLALGMAIGLDRARLQELGLAALLHDVGKAWVPLEVLRKPGPLNHTELALIERHPVDGAVYLERQLEIPPAAAVVAFQHHLRYDQRGYPKLRWPQSPNAYSLVVGIADAYEALTSERPYRTTLSPEDALKVMLETRAGQFEPRLLSVFAEVLGRSSLVAGPVNAK
jgi:HD-GYP domain-containing protein (c-di-GMP phosphodiesterase class II)